MQVASCLYWKGLRLRGDGSPPFESLRAWLEAFEQRPSYVASKSDYYTLVNSLPSQNGPGYLVPAAYGLSAQICGLDGAWTLAEACSAPGVGAPRFDSGRRLEPLAPLECRGGEAAARHEAAFALINNHKRVVRFASRAASPPGKPGFAAELSDPNAMPNEVVCAAVDVALRHVAAAMVDGVDRAKGAALIADLAVAASDGRDADGNLKLAPDWDGPFTDDPSGREYYWNDITGETTYTAPTQGLEACLAYLRDRVGVPRDMGATAATMLRAHLNWAQETLST